MVKIIATFAGISGALENLAQQIVGIVPDDRPFAEIWGWNMPQINRHDFASLVRSPAEKIQRISNLEVDENDSITLARYPNMIQWLSNNVIQNLPGGNSFHVYLTVSSTLESLNLIIDKYIGQTVSLEEIKDKNLLLITLIKEITAVKNQIDNVKQNAKIAETQLDTIEKSAS